MSKKMSKMKRHRKNRRLNKRHPKDFDFELVFGSEDADDFYLESDIKDDIAILFNDDYRDEKYDVRN